MKKQNLYSFGGFVMMMIASVFGNAPQESPKEVNQIPVQQVATTSVISTTTTKSDAVATNTVSTDYTYYTVSSVVDGDTVKINMDGKIETLRLIGLDTPETVDPRKVVQCFGKEASNKAKELLVGKKVRIETDPSQGSKDKYNRMLAYIYLENGLFYNKYMIEQGYAHEYTYNIPYKYQSEFKEAVKKAQDSKLGLWSPDTCNGITTSAKKTTTSKSNVVAPIVKTETKTNSPAIQSEVSKFYTSSYGSSKYYYPEKCDGWKSLNVNYLKSFDSLDKLLVAYPTRVMSPQCE
jgi:micrococcal nuclease